jgi:hypothetical protein
MLDLQKTPKQFCDNIGVAFTEEFFVLGLMNGEAGSAFTITPEHAKRLAQYMAHQIAEYEKKFGTIQTPEWTPSIKSPLSIVKE